tara:strand:- start:385 stop:633 length:249 start_codon:yes stop_codon:yes gene_type:complete
MRTIGELSETETFFLFLAITIITIFLYLYLGSLDDNKSIDKSKMTNRDFFMGFIDPLIFIMGYGSVLLICITLTYFLSIFIF